MERWPQKHIPDFILCLCIGGKKKGKDDIVYKESSWFTLSSSTETAATTSSFNPRGLGKSSCIYSKCSLLSRLFSFTYRRVFVSHSADNPLVSASLGASTDVDNGPHVTKKAVIGTDINGPESCSLATSGLLINGPLLFFFNHFPWWWRRIRNENATSN